MDKALACLQPGVVLADPDQHSALHLPKQLHPTDCITALHYKNPLEIKHFGGIFFTDSCLVLKEPKTLVRSVNSLQQCFLFSIWDFN